MCSLLIGLDWYLECVIVLWVFYLIDVDVNVDEFFIGFDEYCIVYWCFEGGGKYKYLVVYNKDEIFVEFYILGVLENRDLLKEI